jgi:putative tryptophan/tyrosine transport system substrate-binding protein
MWAIALRAQPAERKCVVGVLMGLAQDAETQARAKVIEQGLAQKGWIIGKNLRIEYRFAAGDAERMLSLSKELVALHPDVIIGHSTPVVAALLQVTQAIPIVFVVVTDPVGSGFVASLARPGGNATGFTTSEYSISGKWLELLKEIAPRVTRAAVLRDPTIPAGIGQFASIQSVAQSFGVELSSVDMRDASEIERDVTRFARGSNSGLIVTSSGLAAVHRELIITLSARYRLPSTCRRSCSPQPTKWSSRAFAALLQLPAEVIPMQWGGWTLPN